MSIVLSVSNLSGGYSEVDILRGVDLELHEGQIVTVAGTNGAGKCTLAKAIVGLLPRVTGDVRLGDRSVVDVPPELRAGLGIGYVPQVANVFAGLTILENLQIGCMTAGDRRQIDAMFVRFPALAERRRAYASSLSGGERQQLAFARALVARPRIMVLDEPTAALSPVKVAESFELIKSLPDFGVSVLIIEQRARQALAISDHGYIMDGGKVALSGAAAGLLADEHAAELYLGRGRTEGRGPATGAGAAGR
jgi:branched-chain amino acid transport system ATP-binding protein